MLVSAWLIGGIRRPMQEARARAADRAPIRPPTGPPTAVRWAMGTSAIATGLLADAYGEASATWWLTAIGGTDGIVWLAWPPRTPRAGHVAPCPARAH